MPPKASSKCDHSKLLFSTSSHASSVGYTRASLVQRLAAAQPQAAVKDTRSQEEENSSIFPAPLVLPEDDLALDPKYGRQSLRSWMRLMEGNKATAERRTVYFVGPPAIDPNLKSVQNWREPRRGSAAKERMVDFPKTEDVLGYLEAFYHGLPVKMLPYPNLCFTNDVVNGFIASPHKVRGNGQRNKARKFDSSKIWLDTQNVSGCVEIRTRATPKGDFTNQLNLNDLLDAAIMILPNDAYALLMLVEHDMYEDEEDYFVCGRAFGGSRVAVVSGARYDPILDKAQGLERDHAWPASHCEEYVRRCCDEANDAAEENQKKKKIDVGQTSAGKSKASKNDQNTPMHAALSAHVSLPYLDHSPTVAVLSGLWLGRVCRTASHELGHIFGMDHCVYYACAMQGTSSIIEDARQPPYLCPVDLAKVLGATGADANERDAAMLAYCEKNSAAHMFAAYAAWIRRRTELRENLTKK